MMDDEEGHLFPSFGLAELLANNGHKVVFLSIADNEKLIRDQGYDFFPLFENIYPKGHKGIIVESRLSQVSTDDTNPPVHNLYDHLDEMLKKPFAQLLARVNADLFVVSGYLDIEALLLYYKFGLHPVIFSPGLWEPTTDLVQSCGVSILRDSDLAVQLVELMGVLGLQIRTLDEFISPLRFFHELIACNRELDIREQPIRRETVHYIGPSIRKTHPSAAGRFHIRNHAGSKIIYASLGSQASLYGNISRRFFNIMIGMMRRAEMSACHLVLVIGKETDREALDAPPDNVTVVPWIPQLEVLGMTDLAITHGGLGTIKECIYYGVPMIVLPIARDQHLNARRVEHCLLGISAQLETLSEEELCARALNVLHNQDIRQEIARMQTLFHKNEEEQIGRAVIETLLKKAQKKIP